MTNPAPTPLMTIDALAKYLSVSTATIRGWRLTLTGPPAIRVAGSLRWRLTDVDAWLDAQRDQAVTR